MTQRERNRLETWNAIHDAAAAMTLEDGPVSVTIEAVASRAGVSKRTFFNYFPTKEDAILGTRAPLVSDELLEKFRSSDADLLTRIVRILAGVMATSLGRGHAYQVRRDIITRYPELKGRMVQHINAAEQLVDEILHERMDSEAAEETLNLLPDGQDSARALLMLAGTITRFAYRSDPQGTVADIDLHIDSTVKIFREVMQATHDNA
ncbi:MAG: TetR/AcrR family transcriptional regulator [Micrococcaceae bacterium]|nr:TetR/AcrR family transcriptional regulator [Micrococcaceae bacterium]MDN6169311.1 TetR/AcrR family transcriptional regulator [Micrococcaceae bacterium]MDN6300395.1 TetR/AcrR family transcriptional regulator [Micrococcaceae bacterium]